jgi:hypothetical protein
MASEAGRGPIPVTIFGPQADAAVIEAHAKLGVDRIVFGLPPASRDTVLPLLEQRAKLARQFQ